MCLKTEFGLALSVSLEQIYGATDTNGSKHGAVQTFSHFIISWRSYRSADSDPVDLRHVPRPGCPQPPRWCPCPQSPDHTWGAWFNVTRWVRRKKKSQKQWLRDAHKIRIEWKQKRIMLDLAQRVMSSKNIPKILLIIWNINGHYCNEQWWSQVRGHVTEHNTGR